MDWFIEAMRSMNNGLHNDSTLKETTFILFSACAKIDPSKLGELTERMLPAAAFTQKAHPGLDPVVQFFEQEVANLQTAMIRK